eukprot:7224681-Pyramimonas_sp.AAC.1
MRASSAASARRASTRPGSRRRLARGCAGQTPPSRGPTSRSSPRVASRDLTIDLMRSPLRWNGGASACRAAGMARTARAAFTRDSPGAAWLRPEG